MSNKVTKGRRRTNINIQVKGLMEELFRYHPESSNTTIYEELEKQLRAHPELSVAQLPSLSTLQKDRHAWNQIPADPDPKALDKWVHTRDQNPDDVRAILDVLAEVVENTKGQKKSFTKIEAEWIAHLYPIARGYEAWAIYVMAGLYIRATTDEDRFTLDMLVASARDEEMYPEVDPDNPIVNVEDDDTPLGRATRIHANGWMSDIPLDFFSPSWTPEYEMEIDEDLDDETKENLQRIKDIAKERDNG